MEDRLNHYLQTKGYQRIDSNAQGIYLFYYATEKELTVISVIHTIGNELSKPQYEHILEQIKMNFRGSNPQEIKLLSLIFTANPDLVKPLAIDAARDSHWIVDVRSNRLIIYETETGDFNEIQTILEELLDKEQKEQSIKEESFDYTGANYGQRGERTRSIERYRSSPITMTIIAVNLLVYFMTNILWLGQRMQVLERGALSWYYIREYQQYYRLLTSMFMHLDWSHLVNNMIVLLFIGANLERVTGKMKYLFIYFGTGIVAGATSISYNMWKEYAEVVSSQTSRSVGASGAIFGIVGALLYIVIINKGRLREISFRQMILFVILSLYSGIINSGIDQAAHVGGFISGVLFAAILYRIPPNKNRVQLR